MQYNGINEVASIGEQVVIHFLNIQVTMATVRVVINTLVKFMVQKRIPTLNYFVELYFQIKSTQIKSNQIKPANPLFTHATCRSDKNS